MPRKSVKKAAEIAAGAPADWPANTIVQRFVSNLVPYARNARLHSDEQVEQIAKSIKQFGWTAPVLVDEIGEIIAGHGRILAAKRLGITTVPAMVARGWTESQRRAYVLADNKLTLNSAWDEELLKLELADLAASGFDMSLTGFSESEQAELLRSLSAGVVDPDETPDPPATPVTVLGDVWTLGDHRLICGDATDAAAVEALLGGIVPDLANCDPPYGISVVKRSSIGGAKPFGSAALRGKVRGPARNDIIKPGVYAPVIGDDSTATAIKSYEVLVGLGVPVIVLWGGNYFANALPPSRCWLVWDKENTGSFADAELAWTNQDAVVRLIRHRWSGLIKASERGEKRVHPTQKPVALAEWVIETMAPECATVLDLFGGSGSTLIACERAGKAAFLAELSPDYCDVIIQRWQRFTGKVAVLEATGETFAAVAAQRVPETVAA